MWRPLPTLPGPILSTGVFDSEDSTVSDSSMTSGHTRTLQVAMFATGCSGIVAEYVLSTLATYLLGNAIFQWSIVMSMMLFSMGVGSRVSRSFRNHLLDTFIIIEFSLSLFCAASGAIVFGFAAWTEARIFIIYSLALVVGLFIGMEIPLATRINSDYQALRSNISAVMEMDYFGSLLGGLLFAFLLLPFLGLTYTPLVLGSINFAVAGFLFLRFKHLVRSRRLITVLFALVLLVLMVLAVAVRPIVRYGEQKKYKDLVVLSRQTQFQKIVMTRWKQWYWLYINGDEQFSTYDEERYHEPLVHPAMELALNPERILVLGGGDGLAVREILKHKIVKRITLVDIDGVMTDLAQHHPLFTAINQGAMNDPRVTVLNMDASSFLDSDDGLYNVIFIDLPDPDSMDLMHLYAQGFYRDLLKRLARGGMVVTQASSPYFAKKAFLCIKKTMEAAGLVTLPYHNQVPTLGEWGWILGTSEGDITGERLKTAASRLEFNDIKTRFLNPDAMKAMVLFGKGLFDTGDADAIKINTISNPVLLQYYQEGSWGVY
ncbi:SpeE2 [Desulforapulum autotrophicum HRM2]|uniref:Polyamine aminopropyltransferase n=1 Tax=Desulforapulum autotrophicum (strain ATCC 43914 / DSM 3382 / VKM B-1955 / HRM2) TaxID=177437 RepID=C0QK84_DESAH|nr:SpeE2 [Desulforapulum autotrophicum HRM2]